MKQRGDRSGPQGRRDPTVYCACCAMRQCKFALKTEMLYGRSEIGSVVCDIIAGILCVALRLCTRLAPIIQYQQRNGYDMIL